MHPADEPYVIASFLKRATELAASIRPLMPDAENQRKREEEALRKLPEVEAEAMALQPSHVIADYRKHYNQVAGKLREISEVFKMEDPRLGDFIASYRALKSDANAAGLSENFSFETKCLAIDEGIEEWLHVRGNCGKTLKSTATNIFMHLNKMSKKAQELSVQHGISVALAGTEQPISVAPKINLVKPRMP